MLHLWLLPPSFLLLCVRLARSETTIPAPIDIGTSQQWDGIDGRWSSFPLRVGTPAQNIRVLISTAATNTWVIDDPLGCQGLPLPDCADTRGVLFSANESSSFVDISGGSGFELKVEHHLGLDVQSEAGFDTVGLGFQGSGGPTVNHSVIARINSPDFIVGTLGLNPRPTNFSSFNDPQITFLDQLYHDQAIPSLSYSYSAGANYRQVPGSLTLGGYNVGLFAQNDLSFPFYFDQEYDLTLGLQSITSQVNSTSTSLLPEGILAFIDSTVTQLWLPDAACQRFEDAFGLTYDEDTSFYFLNATQHTALVEKNPNITFTLGAAAKGGKTVDITFPYAAFDLNITIAYPTPRNSSYYFPLRKAANQTQYTLGRVFLQEAYLTVDYGRSTFNVSQRTWDPTQPGRIVAITSTVNTTSSGAPGSTSGASKDAKSKKGGISTGALVAIIIVIIALVAIGAGIFLYFHLRKRKLAQREAMVAAAAATAAAEEQDEKDHNNLTPQQDGLVTEIYTPAIKPPELPGDYYEGHEVPAADVERRAEMEGDEAQRRAEMDAAARSAEMDASATVYYELEAPHGMHEMSTVRGMRLDQRWGETTSPMASPISRRSVPSPVSPRSPPR